VGTDDAAESADDARDAIADLAKCPISAVVECGYATGPRRASPTSSATNHWKSGLSGVQSASSPRV